MKQLEKAKKFCDSYGLDVPIIMAPMAGACPVELAAAICNAGGMGACGALNLEPDQIFSWTEKLRSHTNGSFLLNTWVAGPKPIRNVEHEQQVRKFLSVFGPSIPEEVANQPLISFEKQCQAMLEANPNVISSIMGLFKPAFVEQLRRQKIRWFATVTSVTEAVLAEKAGADALVVQGSEAGGHRGNFITDHDQSAGLMALVPIVADAVNIPIIAAGGIADSRTISAAILLGASAVQIGTGFLRTPEAAIASAWADAIKVTHPEDTITTRAFSGKPGRAIRNLYTAASHDPNNPLPAPYPIQLNFTSEMRSKATFENTIENMQAWAGQSASLAKDARAAELVINLWDGVERIFES